MVNSRRVKPHWLGLLLKTTFFSLCDDHKELRKSEINIYCIECSESMCQHCLSSPSSALRERHDGHHFLQIRRYVYQDVIRVHDMHKYVDCSKVQTFIVNGAKVVLLNPKKQSKPAIAGNNAGAALCGICQRTVPEPNRYCSVACKASEAGNNGGGGGGGGGGFGGSEPFLSSVNSDLEGLSAPKEGGSSSAVSSPLPSDTSGEVRQGNPSSGSPARRRARKGVPRRARFF